MVLARAFARAAILVGRNNKPIYLNGLVASQSLKTLTLIVHASVAVVNALNNVGAMLVDNCACSPTTKRKKKKYS